MKLSQEEFIKKAKQRHGSKYVYSKVVYQGNKIKIIIICPEHGDFYMTPSCHLNGQGCRECGLQKRARNSRKPLEQFLTEAINTHGNKYDYSLVKKDYEGYTKKVKIICPVGHIFEQKPCEHINGHGCGYCAGQYMTGADFIESANKVHNYRYKYDKVVYVNTMSHVIIICPEHGEFKQIPNDHKQGAGCPDCGVIATVKKHTLTKDQFIEKAAVIHGDKYDYTKSHYIKMKIPVEIICKKHNTSFFQTPTNHIHCQAGCPTCARETNTHGTGGYCEEYFTKYPDTKNNPGILYFVEIRTQTEHFYKIGMTKNSIKNRFQNHPKTKINVLIKYETTLYNAHLLEKEILTEYKHLQYIPTSFCGGHMECFVLDKVLVQEIRNKLPYRELSEHTV